ncbi:2-dehydropantoate 2-reductase N-terminal domain-containing protein [Kitasatospora sp. CB01950]|uniref:2-dehydropantoate 2-reductase N-terminal domain-containing protein n=1 Tax=Kitasatospora sp. CB01950 TaxID=1703930 RepID=UPI000A8D026B|nr:2-dehydropantoate 2-reductase N-terminal domain-containing protein [Kitasatospora sp. CB01950]
MPEDRAVPPLRITVFGAGSIGCRLGGALAAVADVTLVGRPAAMAELDRAGLTLTGPGDRRLHTRPATATDASAAAGADYVLVTVKSADTTAAARALAPHLDPRTTVISFQNGLHNARLLADALPAHRVLAGMVPYNVVRTAPAAFHQGTQGHLMLARIPTPPTSPADRPPAGQNPTSATQPPAASESPDAAWPPAGQNPAPATRPPAASESPDARQPPAGQNPTDRLTDADQPPAGQNPTPATQPPAASHFLPTQQPPAGQSPVSPTSPEHAASAEQFASRFAEAARAAGLPVELRDDMPQVQAAKLLMNLNNAVNALSGRPLREQLGSRPYRLVLARCQREGLAALRAAGLRPARLSPVPAGWMPAVLRLPDALFRRLAAASLRVDAQARSSMWEDLQRGRRTEIDSLQGEILALAERHRLPAPANRRLLELVRAAESSPTPPSWSGPDLLAALDAQEG